MGNCKKSVLMANIFLHKKNRKSTSRKTNTFILAQKSLCPIICRTTSQLTFTETECYQNEITKFYQKTQRNNYRDQSDEIFCSKTDFTC